MKRRHEGVTDACSGVRIFCRRCSQETVANERMARGRGTFGLTSTRGGGGRGSFRSGGSWRGGSWRGRGRGRGGSKAGGGPGPKREDDGTQLAERFERARLEDEVDEKLGFARVQEGGTKEGWLVNMHPVSLAIY